MTIMSPNFKKGLHQIVICKNLLLYISLVLMNNSVFSDQQTIKLFDYVQEDSDTHCTNGLISGVDTVVFKSIVKYSQDPTMKYAFFFIKRKLDEIFVLEKEYNIQHDCHDINSNDCRHIDEHTAEIYLHIKASKNISGARLRGKLITSSQEDIISNEQIIPEVYDLKDQHVSLIINEKQHNGYYDDCNYNASDSELSLFFMLESKLSPFYIEMSSKDLQIHLKGNGSVEYQLTTRFNTTITYYPCRMEGHVNAIRCSIQIAQTENVSFVSHDNYSVKINILIAIGYILLIIIIIGMICIIIYLMKILHKARSKPDILDQRTTFKPDQSPQAIVEGDRHKRMCGNISSCHDVKEAMQTCTVEFGDEDGEDKHDKKIEDEPVEKQETNPLILPKDKNKGSPLPKEDYCENKEEEAKEAHNSYITMNRYLTLTEPDTTARHNGRRTIQENNHEQLLDMFGVKKK